MIGNRKFTISVLSLVMAFILALMGNLAGSEFVTLVGLVVGLFGGANAAVHIARDSKDEPDEPTLRIDRDKEP